MLSYYYVCFVVRGRSGREEVVKVQFRKWCIIYAKWYLIYTCIIYAQKPSENELE